MNSINTNINEYNYNEIKDILNLSNTDYNMNSLFTLINEKITLVEDSKELNTLEKNDLCTFFKNVFYKLCHYEKWSPNLKINKYFAVYDDNKYEDEHKNDYILESINDLRSLIKNQSLQNNVNPITPPCIKQIISIDSLYRDNYDSTSSTDFTISLPIEYDNVIQMKLSSAEIPNTYYIFNEKLNNNKFQIEILENNIFKSIEQIVIPSGSFYADEIKTFINNILNFNEDPYVRCLLFGVDFNSGKSFFRFKTDTELDGPDIEEIPEDIDIKTLSYRLNIDKSKVKSFEESALYSFGFTSSVIEKQVLYEDTYNYGVDTYPGYLESKFIYGFNFNNYFYLCVEDFVGNKKDQIVGIKNKSYIGKNILARIQITNPIFNLILNSNEDNVFKTRNYFGDVKIRKLRIQILDKFGNVIDLNHSEISLSIELTQRYNSDQQNTFNRVINKGSNY